MFAVIDLAMWALVGAAVLGPTLAVMISLRDRNRLTNRLSNLEDVLRRMRPSDPAGQFDDRGDETSLELSRERIVLTGFSQGGQMAFFIGLSQAEKFRGVIPVAGSYDPGFALLLDAASRPKTRFYLMVGADDRARTVDSNRQAEKDLRAAGIGVTLTVFPNLGHSFPENRAEELGKALREVLAKP